MKLVSGWRWLVAVLLAMASGISIAEDTFKLAIGQRGNWENAAPELGQKAGFFRKHGVTGGYQREPRQRGP
jgi:NitT/TauT family transport system substrate-binding protein